MANGGLIAPVGLNMVALAAQRHAVPFVVVAGSHKVIVYDLIIIKHLLPVPKKLQQLYIAQRLKIVGPFELWVLLKEIHDS